MTSNADTTTTRLSRADIAEEVRLTANLDAEDMARVLKLLARDCEAYMTALERVRDTQHLSVSEYEKKYDWPPGKPWPTIDEIVDEVLL